MHLDVSEKAGVSHCNVSPTDRADCEVGGSNFGALTKVQLGFIVGFHHATVSGVDLGEMELSFSFKSQTEPLTPKLVSNSVFFLF